MSSCCVSPAWRHPASAGGLCPHQPYLPPPGTEETGIRHSRRGQVSEFSVELEGGVVVVCWLLNVPATGECISGTDLLRQFLRAATLR